MQQIPLISKSQSCHQRRLPTSQLHLHNQQQPNAFIIPAESAIQQTQIEHFNKMLVFSQAEHLSIEQSKTRTSTYSKASKDETIMQAFADEGKTTFLNPVDRHLEDTSQPAALQFSSMENRSPLRSN
jgi:hypothetical protein